MNNGLNINLLIESFSMNWFDQHKTRKDHYDG